MKKFLSILLIVVLLISLSACKKNSSKNGTNENKTTADVIKIECFIDDTFENKISFNIPKNLKDKYAQKTSSSFSDGYYSVTICVKDTDFDLFTIYCSKNDSYKNFEKEKNYEVLKKNKGYTCIWYEYGYVMADGSKMPQIIEDFKIEYKTIKTSFTIE